MVASLCKSFDNPKVFHLILKVGSFQSHRCLQSNHGKDMLRLEIVRGPTKSNNSYKEGNKQRGRGP